MVSIKPRFKTGGRCDVVDLTEGIIYEILHMETDKMFEENKAGKYPEEFRVIKVRCASQPI